MFKKFFCTIIDWKQRFRQVYNPKRSSSFNKQHTKFWPVLRPKATRYSNDKESIS
uniref:Uncharacterized protein n=1 Tax=Rhizophora mucronata TaxID=61149 RepID=A0A2P2NBN1_RHIMU